MKLNYIIWALCLSLEMKGQVITTVAGSGSGGDGSLATLANIVSPETITFDRSGNLFFTEILSHKIRKVSTSGIITTIAGTGVTGFFGDGGQASNAQFNLPYGIATDLAGNIYISDASNHRIRKIDIVTNTIETIAGNGVGGYSGDGIPATSAQINYPWGLCFYKGELYFADNSNHRVRKIDSFGIIKTIAGNGVANNNGDGSQATTSSCTPTDVAIDETGNIYIGTGSYGKVRKVNTVGIISTIAGDGTSTIFNGDGLPATNAHIDASFVAVDKYGSVYISETSNYRIRKVDASGYINTVAGNGTSGSGGDGGLASAAQISNSSGITIDSCDNLFMAQVNFPRIRRVAYPHCYYLNANIFFRQGIL